jgi:transposase InsO family protein
MNFLSELVLEICIQLRIKKLNTSGYHSQTNGLVEKFNSTLIGMVSKVVESSGRDWDRHLPFLLFAYRVSIHESTRESPFYFIYGRDARIPSETVLEQKVSPYRVDVDIHRHDLVDSLTTAWALAREYIKGAETNV